MTHNKPYVFAGLLIVLVSVTFAKPLHANTPLRSFSDVMEAAFYITKRNPQFINDYISRMTPENVAKCAVLGIKTSVVAATEPKLFANNVQAKIHGLSLAVSNLAAESMRSQGKLSKQTYDAYIARFKMMDLADILQQHWKTCDSAIASSMKSLPPAQLKAYVNIPYIP